MPYKTLLVDDRDGIVTVTLNRPEVHNAFNDELIAEAIELFDGLARSSARAVVLRGSGANFCAGADLNWMSRMVAYTRDENVRDSARALRIGLVHRVADDLDAAVDETIAQLRTSGPEAVRECKKLIAHVAASELAEAVPYTIEAIAARRVSEEGQGGMSAFLKKE